MKNQMKKLRFVAFMMGAILMSAGFTACSSDDDDQVIITVDKDTSTEVTVGETVHIIFNVYSDSKLKEVIIRESNVDRLFVDNFKNNNSYAADFTYITTEAGKLDFTIIATDKNNLEDHKTVSVVVNPVATPLSEVEEVELIYTGASSTNKNTSDILGLRYASNKADGNTAEFKIFAPGEKFAFISEEVANVITTKEELASAYEASTDKKEEFTAQSDAKFKKTWFISKVGDEYVWIEFASLKFKAGDNRAVFNFKN